MDAPTPMSFGEALREHWPEYLMEAAGLGIFMISAGAFGALLWYPGSPVSQAVDSELLRRALMGIAMGLTAVGLIYSPWGQRSGAHLNPAVTLSFLRLGKIRRADAFFYMVAQFLGGLLGVFLVALFAREAFAHDKVRYVVTVPGAPGVAVAFFAELLISGGLMLMVLVTMNRERLSRLTGLFAGLLLFVYITVEAPYSGMSINPARTVASALPAGIWTHVWLYFVAPILGMQLAVTVNSFSRRADQHCAKLFHSDTRSCIHCGYEPTSEEKS